MGTEPHLQNSKCKQAPHPSSCNTERASVTALGTAGCDCQRVHISPLMPVPSTLSKPPHCSVASQCQVRGKLASAGCCRVSQTLMGVHYRILKTFWVTVGNVKNGEKKQESRADVVAPRHLPETVVSGVFRSL